LSNLNKNRKNISGFIHKKCVESFYTLKLNGLRRPEYSPLQIKYFCSSQSFLERTETVVDLRAVTLLGCQKFARAD